MFATLSFAEFAPAIAERAAARQLYYFTYEQMKKIAGPQHNEKKTARRRLQGTLACRSAY
jgi:hypothetical protein